VILDTETVCLVIFTLSSVDFTIIMDITTFSVSFIVFPVALVHGSINPNLNAPSLSATRLIPLARVLCSIIEHDLRLGHVALPDILIVDEGRQLTVNGFDQFVSFSPLGVGLRLLIRFVASYGDGRLRGL
jgi:hypothetical protein